MFRIMLGGVVAASMLAAPICAQTAAARRDAATEAARGYVGVPSPAEPAVDAQQQPITRALNAEGAAGAQVQAAQSAEQVAAQSQYDSDRAAYVDALVRHDRAVDRTDARYGRQQRAYADAMAVWRVQQDECKKGHRKACKAPTPNVADYY